MPAVTTVVSSSNIADQVDHGDPLGAILGGTATTPVGFYGTASPAQRASGNAQAALTRGQQAGMMLSLTAVQSPTSVQAQSNTEFTVNAMGNSAAMPIQGTDFIYVNKPTAQAGLGIANVRAAGVNNIALALFNMTGTTITPTGGETYEFVALKGVGALSAVLSPAAIQANAAVEQTFTITGLRTGEVVQVNKPTNQSGLAIAGTRVVSNNTLGITFANVTGTTITPTAAETYTVYSLGGLDGANNEIHLQIAGAPTSIQANTITEFMLPVSGLALGDAVVGVSKPTLQAGLMLTANWRVSVPGAIGLSFYNNTGTTITPTAGEVYEIALRRANPTAPAVLYTPTLSPTSVPGNTTAEQTFTVTGLIASTPVVVNKPTAQNNLGIVNARVSATNTLALTFLNTQANSILPTASEVYAVLNFQDPNQTGGLNSILNGNSMGRAVVPAGLQQSILANALRSALAGTNFIAGA